MHVEDPAALIKELAIAPSEVLVLSGLSDRHVELAVGGGHRQIVVPGAGIVKGARLADHRLDLRLGPVSCRETGVDALEKIERLDVARTVREALAADALRRGGRA